jgi:hypothetical protein
MDDHYGLQINVLEPIMNSLQIIGILGVMFATSFVWYWTGHKDGVREGYTRGRSISRQEFWKE